MDGRLRRTGSGVGFTVAVLLGVGCDAGGASEPERNPTAGTFRDASPTSDGGSGSLSSAAPTPGPTTSARPAPLLPNMRSLPAEDVQIQRTDNGRELRFAAALANSGDGPLVLTPDEDMPCPEGERHASQVVYRDVNGNGTFDPDTDIDRDVVPAGCMLFHPSHEHWHFDASASYLLTRPGDDTPVVASDKVSFCMRDSRRLPGEQWADARETYEECERDRRQGITAGWADVYDADLDGQALPLADDLADGVYCLRLTADPFDLLRETDEDDNSAAIAIEITGAAATPSGSDRCAQ